MNADVIQHLEIAIRNQREENAAGYDRERALVELRGIAIDTAVALNRHELSPEQLWAAAETPEQHARLQSLADRALQTPEEVPA